MKKKLIWIFSGIALLVFIIIQIRLFLFLSKTMSVSETRQYCIDNTTINATSFRPVRHIEQNSENKTEYSFWAAEDGLSNRQELFIFHGVQFGPFKSSMKWERHQFNHHTSSTTDEIVGSIMFTPRNTKNQKSSTNWIAFYSSNGYDICHHILTIEEDGNICTIEMGSSSRMAFVTILPDLGVKDGVLRKFIKAEFFDENWNLVEVITADSINDQTSENDIM